MRVVRARWTKAVGECHNNNKPGDHCRLYSREWVDLCLFDEGFLLGYEFAKSSSPSPDVPTTIKVTPGEPQLNQKEAS